MLIHRVLLSHAFEREIIHGEWKGKISSNKFEDFFFLQTNE
jgi:hypothetical protein